MPNADTRLKLQSSLSQETALCIVCGSRNFNKTIYGGHFYGNKKYDIVRCRKCGFMFLNPLPEKLTLDNIYNTDDYFDSYYVTVSGKKPYLEAMADYTEADEKIIKIIKKYKQDGRLLDVGCAGGHFLMNARKSGFKTFGVEPNKKMAEHARVVLGLDVVCGTLEDVDYEPDYFDIIHAGDVLEHMLNIRKSLEVLKTLLKEDGILIINQPLLYNKSLFDLFLKFNMLFKKNRYSNNPPAHLWEFNSTAIKKFLKNLGFEIIYYKVSEVQAKPLSVDKNHTLKNRIGYYIKNFSSIISNSLLFKMFEFGDRAIIVCKK
ncbi:MAG: class I SAM-dependent methyltransferase [Candidatus Omnitrophica bacterium]|nr:class I SAM-dependent methyltransferase [Candidatus Omnitrophota bacterium]